ncbi:ketopantoate reductase family protein [Oceanobacillus polygoni]|uniref:2-dehydropantoate 2-reductase n=1 Tax=Oceanobacillus polygoni TaxID=1235259 RepID=A0A9X1CKT8_9BACI|nr:ketopantoate reductase family protein [Oceanobacillus polygoni]MBP2079542.1 2-dehydropantoate 2-reductase [Oceanobacillus polygoni]
MKRIQSVALIGLGAIGAAYGSKLHTLLGDAFTVIANKERINRYTASGLDVDGTMFHFNYKTSEANAEPADLVIFAVKNDHLEQALTDMEHHIGPNTIILSLLNGISSEEEIYNNTRNEHILYSMCVGIDAVRRDNRIRFSSIGKICFGEKDQSHSEDVLAVKDLFERARIPYEIPEDIRHTIWAKFMFNVGINQISAVLRAPYKYFQEVPSLHKWMEQAMYEVVAISQEVGVNLTEADVHSYRTILMKLSPDGQTSMLQDIVEERKTEVEYFAGKVCELGRKYGIPTPVNDQLYQLIPIIEDIASLK